MTKHTVEPPDGAKLTRDERVTLYMRILKIDRAAADLMIGIEEGARKGDMQVVEPPKS